MAEGMDPLDEFLPFHLCDDLVCCVVCYEPFTENKTPKALPCLHSFCKSCLTACIQAYQSQKRPKTKDKKGSKGEFPCPICKDVIKIPLNGLDGFRDDFRIRRISEIVAKSREIVRNSSSENLLANQNTIAENDSCDVCRISKIDAAGENYCLDCFKILCKTCTGSHKDMPLTADHKLVETPESSDNGKLPSSSTCPQHTSEPLRYYCKDCKHAVCVTCSIDTDHKDHEMVRLAEQVNTVKDDVTGVISAAMKELSEAEKQKEEIEELEKELKTKEITVKRAILSKTLEEIFRARQRQHKMEQDLDEMCSVKASILREKIGEYTKFTKSMRSKCYMMESIIEHGHDLHIVHAADEYAPKVKSHITNDLPSIGQLSKITELGKYDTFLTELYDAKENSSEDSQESILSEIRAVVSEIRHLSTKQTTRKESPSPKPKKKVELIKKIGRKGNQEGEFSFPSGITFLPSGELVVADMHNHRIQVFDPSGTYLRSFGGPNLRPCGITVNASGDLAVTDCSTGKAAIKVFSPTGQLKQSLAEGNFEYPFSIAVDSNRRYIVCDSSTNRIVVLKESGVLNRRFTTRTKLAFYLTVNQKNEILLSDWFNNCVKVFDCNGILLRKIGSKGVSDGQIMIPLGLSPLPNGDILVLDCKCGRVTQFTTEGKFVKHVISKNEGIEYSRAIAMSTTGMLAVSSGDNRGNIPNEIHLYQINA